MILQALKEYYDRKATDPDSDIAPLGWERKEIRFVVVLNGDGTFFNVEDTEEKINGKKRSKIFLVPQGVKRASGIKSNLLWDNHEYALGLLDIEALSDKDAENEKEKVDKRFEAFKERISGLDKGLKSAGINDAGINAVSKFLNEETLRISEECSELQSKVKILDGMDKADPLFASAEKEIRENKYYKFYEIARSSANITFRLKDDSDIVCNRDKIKSFIDSHINLKKSGDRSVLCLVTGKHDKLAELHPAIKGVWNAQSSGANIISFNKDAFTSFNKKQGANSPVGEKAAFEYTTALNYLLKSEQRMQVGDCSTVFWAGKQDSLENDFGLFFSDSPKDDPDRQTNAVRSLFDSPKAGVLSVDDESRCKFYVLGLAPNASRIAVKFWIVSSVAEMKDNVKLHFDDLEIIHSGKEAPYLSIFKLLVSLAVQGKSDNIPPNLSGDLMRAVLNGTRYPQILLSSAVERIKAEKYVSYPRAALIKAVINRFERIVHNTKEELKVSLDTETKNTPYRLGRLFAVLEKIQEEANPGISVTIRDRFYAAASSSPVTVFGNLMRLKNYHLAKLQIGRKIYFEKLLSDINSEFSSKGFPVHLNLQEQGRFAIGYYHQRQDFYTKKDKDIKENENGTN